MQKKIDEGQVTLKLRDLKSYYQEKAFKADRSLHWWLVNILKKEKAKCEGSIFIRP